MSDPISHVGVDRDGIRLLDGHAVEHEFAQLAVSEDASTSANSTRVLIPSISRRILDVHRASTLCP